MGSTIIKQHEDVRHHGKAVDVQAKLFLKFKFYEVCCEFTCIYCDTVWQKPEGDIPSMEIDAACHGHQARAFDPAIPDTASTRRRMNDQPRRYTACYRYAG
jgi:hypothetical protein